MTRELDIAVARALGWQDWCPLPMNVPTLAVLLPPRTDEWVTLGVTFDLRAVRVATPDDRRATDYDRYVPRYSTDANEAARLWAEVLPGAWAVAPDDERSTWIIHKAWTFENVVANVPTFLAEAATLAEAICNAVVAVRGGEAPAATKGGTDA